MPHDKVKKPKITSKGKVDGRSYTSAEACRKAREKLKRLIKIGKKYSNIYVSDSEDDDDTMKEQTETETSVWESGPEENKLTKPPLTRETNDPVSKQLENESEIEVLKKQIVKDFI